MPMTLPTFFAVLVPAYLVLIAYGVVGARRRGLPGRPRAVAAGLTVVLLPVGILVALHATGDARLASALRTLALAMLGFGVATALLTEFIARRVGS